MRSNLTPFRVVGASTTLVTDSSAASKSCLGDEVEAGEASLLDDATFRSIYPELRRFAAVCADGQTDPDDLVRDGVCGFLRSKPASVRNLKAYLRRSIYHAAIQRHRRASARPETPLGDEEDLGVHDQYEADVRSLLFLVAPASRAVLYLVDVQGLSSRETAEILGTSSMNVRARAARSRKAVRSTLERLDRDESAR